MTNSKHDKQGTKYDASSVLNKQLSELCVTGLGITQQSIMLMVMLGKNDKPTLPTRSKTINKVLAYITISCAKGSNKSVKGKVVSR